MTWPGPHEAKGEREDREDGFHRPQPRRSAGGRHPENREGPPAEPRKTPHSSLFRIQGTLQARESER
jgi:hypothetical protein